MFLFRKRNVIFETPPQRKKASLSTTVQRTVLGGHYSPGDDAVTPLEGIDIVSPEIALFGRRLMTEVEERSKQHFQSGWSVSSVCVVLFFWLFLCLLRGFGIYVVVSSVDYTSGPCFSGLRVVGFNDLFEKVESRLDRTKSKKYSSRNLLHRRMLSRHAVFGDFVTG